MSRVKFGTYGGEWRDINFLASDKPKYQNFFPLICLEPFKKLAVGGWCVVVVVGGGQKAF